MFSKKSQTQQVFVYILTVIIVGMVFLFGYKSITYFMAKGDIVTLADFKKKITDEVRIVGPEYGKVDRREFFPGGKYSEICFVDSDANSPEIPNTYPVIKDLIGSKIPENAFLLSAKQLKEKFDVGKIEITGRFLCVNLVSGRLKLQFEGLGDRTLIKKWE